MRELNSTEAAYVDQMAGTIINGMIVKNPNSFNTDYFRMIGQTAYQLALVMLEVRNEKISVVVENAAMAVVPVHAHDALVLSEEPLPVKKKGGRPKGSKNKNKKAPVSIEPLSSLS